MLCPCRTSTPRAPQLQQQRRAVGAALAPVLVLSPTSAPALGLHPAPLRARRKRRPAQVVAAAAPPAQEASCPRGDGLITSAAAAAGTAAASASASASSASSASPAPVTPQTVVVPSPVAPDALLVEFEHKLQGDLKAVGVTIVAITGVIVFWRGVWSMLDHLLGDSVFGDVACVVIGLLIVLGVRLSGAKMSSFWPTS